MSEAASRRFLQPSLGLTRVELAVPLILLLIGLTLSSCGQAPEQQDADQTGYDKDTQRSDSQQLAYDDPPPVFEAIPGFGYQPRACGFDLDDDGIIGEPADDCRVCDGTTTDPDGDGVDEDLIYVACGDGTADATGVDDSACGAPDRPCATLAFGWSRADGADDGAEDILCFRGTCREPETLQPRVAGVAGTVLVPAEGNQGRDFERAANPAMLVGWDFDGDGDYPPHDPEDQAILAGDGAAARALRLDARNDRFELAHFEVRAYGVDRDEKDSGFIEFGRSQGELDHVYLHDLHLLNINKGRVTASEVSTIDLFAGKTRPRWLWFDNLWAPRTGGWFARGNGADPELGQESGPWRFANISLSARGCDFDDCQNGAAFTAFHIWGHVSGIELVDINADAGTDDWQPKPKGGPSGARFALVAQCTQDWLIRHNRIVDFKNVLRIQGWAERYCDNAQARPVTGVVFDHNQVSNDYRAWGAGTMGVYVSEGGDDAAEVVADVTIAHNVLSSNVGWDACLWLHGGNGATTPPGAVTVAHNTCLGDVNFQGALVFGDKAERMPAYPHSNVEVIGNIVTGLGVEDPNVRLHYSSRGMRFDDNRFDPAGGFVLGEDEIADLEGWQQATGLDDGSRACLPAFVDLDRGDLTLTSDDDCARGANTSGAERFSSRVDNGQRPVDESWDAGARQSKTATDSVR